MSYTDRLEIFRRVDAERDGMVEELMRNLEELQLKYSEKADDYNNEVESRRMWQSKANSSERALTEQRQASVCRKGSTSWRTLLTLLGI